MPVDLSTLIFEEILKISPELLARYPTVQDKLLYLILIPHVVLFMFLWGFGDWIIKHHATIRKLLIMATYIYLIWSGFYGSIFVPIVNAWFTIMVIVAFVFFILTRTFSPLRVSTLANVAYGLGRKLREPREMEERLREINNVLISTGLKGSVARELKTNPYRQISQEDFDDRVKKNKDLMTAIFPLLLEREKIIRKLKERY